MRVILNQNMSVLCTSDPFMLKLIFLLNFVYFFGTLKCKYLEPEVHLFPKLVLCASLKGVINIETFSVHNYYHDDDLSSNH